MSTPMMKCGHAANAVHKGKDGVDTPCCVICFMATGDASEQVADPPNLTGRMASCNYHGSCRNRGGRNSYSNRRDKPDYGMFDKSGHAVAPSSTDLPFFSHHPDKPQDEYYCGCFGWD